MTDGVLLEIRESAMLVAEVIIYKIGPGKNANVMFIPQPQFFGPSAEFSQQMSEVMRPLMQQLFEAYALRRITSRVPRTRNRTAKALLACGFKKEGVMRDALKFVGKPAEDMIIMGLLSREV